MGMEPSLGVLKHPKSQPSLSEEDSVNMEETDSFSLLAHLFPQEFPFRKCQLQDGVTQLEAEAAPKVQEAQPKEPGKAGAGSPPQAVLLQWREPKRGPRRPQQPPMLHTGTMCLKVRRPWGRGGLCCFFA